MISSTHSGTLSCGEFNSWFVNCCEFEIAVSVFESMKVDVRVSFRRMMRVMSGNSGSGNSRNLDAAVYKKSSTQDDDGDADADQHERSESEEGSNADSRDNSPRSSQSDFCIVE